MAFDFGYFSQPNSVGTRPDEIRIGRQSGFEISGSIETPRQV